MPINETTKETCPYCKKLIELSFGRNIQCPECGKKLNVFDNKHPLKPQGIITVEKHFQMKLLKKSGSVDDILDEQILKLLADSLNTSTR